MSMKSWNRIPALPVALAALFALAATSIAQDQAGPTKDVDQTVAKPRKSTGEPEEAPIPSKLSKKAQPDIDRKSTRLNSSHLGISYAVFCLKKKYQIKMNQHRRYRRTPRIHAGCLHPFD